MKEERKKIGDLEIAKAVIAHEAVDCFLGKELEKSAQPKKLLSCTGGTFWGVSGEKWPLDTDGKPLIPWLQIVCTEMKKLFGAFHEKKAVCFYIRQDFSDFEAVSTDNGGDFVVREYGLLDNLVALDRPKALKNHPFHQVVWKSLPDYPSMSKYYNLFEGEIYDSLCKIKKFKYENRSGIKIGGWPTPLQKNQEYPGSYDLQIDMTENYMYGDSGVGYLSRDGEQWYVMFESC